MNFPLPGFFVGASGSNGGFPRHYRDFRAALDRHTHGPELVLGHPDPDALADRADDASGNDQLERRHVAEQDRPGNR